MTTEQDFLALVAARLGRTPGEAPPRFRPSQPLPAVGPTEAAALADRFQLELEKISGVVHRVNDASEVAPTVVRILQAAQDAADEAARGSGPGPGASDPSRPGPPVARWDDPLLDGFGIDAALEEAGWPVIRFRAGDDGRAFAARVERAFAGVVACDAAIAETGTIVLHSGPTRGRTVSLLPPVLIAVLRKEQIVFDAARLFRRLARAPMPSQVIFKSGPSRSSDIENDLTIGIHGPGDLHVILL